jgi:hypothetical protein
MRVLVSIAIERRAVFMTPLAGRTKMQPGYRPESISKQSTKFSSNEMRRVVPEN